MKLLKRPKKSLGQNFLIDRNIINKIVKIGDIGKNKIILEIGPGYGSLTKEISKKQPKKIFAVEKDTKLEGIVQANNFEVNSIHHQGIDKLGEDLIISARSDDGVIEGIEITNGWDAIGIQWHPEYLDDEPTSKIYDWLINS